MAEMFHWVIFALHFVAAVVLTYSVWFRCDQGLWISRMHVDSYALPAYNGTDADDAGNPGLWWDAANLTEAAACAADPWEDPPRPPGLACFMRDLPLYDRASPRLGWHLFALLGHFEWMSAAFAFFYIDGSWRRTSWAISTVMAVVGTLIYLPWRLDDVFFNEVLLLLVNGGVCSAVFFAHRDVHRQIAEADPPPPPPSEPQPTGLPQRGAFRVPTQWGRPPRLDGLGNLRTGSLRLATLPALRFAEYTITASELFVAVLSLFVADAPAFMTIGGYTLLLLCNLYGALLHYSLVADHGSPAAELATTPYGRTRTLIMAQASHWRAMVVPKGWLGVDPDPSAPPPPAAHGWGWTEDYLSRRYAWGSFIASNTSTLLNSWFVFALALVLVFYQQTFLFSLDPPWYVVLSGWSLLVFYTSFGVWVTAVYTCPERVSAALAWGAQGPEETYLLVVRGLDVLSVLAKLSVVSFLSFGFVFSADGRC